ncbi:hypothetical protein CCM_00906 [Cordyceps militaris CM01]|uniref:Aminoglycoside phosphotransferase domain-containing protein n=1 Tax=Cordyceps militaris (strain CM01) TaxID=983644 RepID=G3J6X4_CORMM|nr:uncharacterized protein CCM_00906 [Cordyceps militaris CM01]EGX96251.1 hypothetical protein CCM_00906 [Cordyceps militaris CM01]
MTAPTLAEAAKRGRHIGNEQPTPIYPIKDDDSCTRGQGSWTWCWIAPREPGQVSIHQYISGRPLDQLEILHNSTDALRPLLAELGDSLAQLRARAQEFHDGVRDGVFNVINRPGLCDVPFRDPASATQPTIGGIDKREAQREVFALQDFRFRLFPLIDPMLNLQPFVLSPGDLRPSNIIVNEDRPWQGSSTANGAALCLFSSNHQCG